LNDFEWEKKNPTGSENVQVWGDANPTKKKDLVAKTQITLTKSPPPTNLVPIGREMDTKKISGSSKGGKKRSMEK